MNCKTLIKMENKILTKKEQAELLGGIVSGDVASSVAAGAIVINRNNAPACLCRYDNTPLILNTNRKGLPCSCVCV
jgi:hypothetical protein